MKLKYLLFHFLKKYTIRSMMA